MAPCIVDLASTSRHHFSKTESAPATMKRAAAAASPLTASDETLLQQPPTGTGVVRLLLHCEDGTIPYMTPFLLRKHVPPSPDFWIGLAVQDTCVVPLFKQQSSSTGGTSSTKPCGYSFGIKGGLDSSLLPYNRVTVPSFDLLQDDADKGHARANGGRPTRVSATNGHVQVWTPHGRQKLTSALYGQAAQGLKSQATVPLYDMAMENESKNRKENARRRNAAWLNDFITNNEQSAVWAPVVLGMGSQTSTGTDEEIAKLVDGIAFVGRNEDLDLASQLKPYIESVSPNSIVALLSTRSTLELLDAARVGVNMIGTALPSKWAKSKLAFVVPFRADDSCKRAKLDTDQKTEETHSYEILDEDGCIDMGDERWARDTLPLTPGCTCMACSAHTRAYVQHLVQAKELLAEILLFAHNLHRLRELCRLLSADADSACDVVKSRLRRGSQ